MAKIGKNITFLITACMVTTFVQGQFEPNPKVDSIIGMIVSADSDRIGLLDDELLKLENEGNISGQLRLLGTKLRLSPPDSSLAIIRRIKDLVRLPGQERFRVQALFFEGFHYFRKREYNRAAPVFIEAIEWGRKYPNDFVTSRSLHALALMKQRFTDYPGARESLRAVESLYEKNSDSIGLANIRFALFSLYLEMGKQDSARYHLDRARKIGDVPKSTQALLRLGEGICLSNEGYHSSSNDTLKMVEPVLEKRKDYANLAFCYFYQGRNYGELGRDGLRYDNFKKVDSLFSVNDYLPKMLRPTFEYLIYYHRQRGEMDSTLNYTRNLIRFDSMQSKLALGLQRKIIGDYEVNRLKREQAAQLEEKENKINTYVPALYILATLLVTAISILLVYRRREKRKDERFEQLKKRLSDNGKPEPGVTVKKKIPSISQKSADSLDAFFEVVEREKLFLDPDFGVKFINGRTKVNEHDIAAYVKMSLERANLKEYVNDKRIEEAIYRFINDKRFAQRITLGAMANELGYRTSRTFNKAFYERHGMKPMDFLARLKNSGKNR